MTMDSRDKKSLAVVICLFAIALVAGLVWSPSFRSDLLSPLAPQNGALAGAVPTASSSVPMYQPVDQYEQDVVNAVKTASPAVVSITISEDVPVVENCPYDPFQGLPPEFQQFFGGGSGDDGGDGSSGLTQPCDTGQTQLQEVGGGSGFIISSDGLILTNKHVVSDTNASYSVLTNDGKTYTAKVLARDPNQDLALLKINATGLPTVTIGDSESLELGQTAIAIGNALGQFSNTVSVGVVSGLERTVTASSPDDSGTQETITGVIQTDAAINPGNSGGPLRNLRGQVIGIDTAIASDAQNIGFAIPIDQAKSVISSFEATGQIQAPYLGVRYLMVTPDIATAQNLAISYGALVRGDDSGPAVVAGSPAAKAGLQAEDIIESVNGQQLSNGTDLGNVIDQFTVGQTITLVINRAGKEMTVQVTLAVRPASADN
jgi:serine protease Do